LLIAVTQFINCGVNDSVSPIVWGGSSTLCASMGDIFDSTLKVSNSGNQNLILDPQINNLNTVTNAAAIIGSNIVVISNTNVANSLTTGALRVAGGTSIGGNLYVGGNIVVTSTNNAAITSSGNILMTANTRVSVTRSPFRVANMNTTARNLISASNADIIYNTTDNKFQGFQNGIWINLDDGTPA
jgi:NDP-sugar pyrophosphorylase family protein